VHVLKNSPGPRADVMRRDFCQLLRYSYALGHIFLTYEVDDILHQTNPAPGFSQEISMTSQTDRQTAPVSDA
jgi:hypothetical protein